MYYLRLEGAATSGIFSLTLALVKPFGQVSSFFPDFLLFYMSYSSFRLVQRVQ